MLEALLPGITSANCWAHARRDYADAIKALGTKNKKANAETVAGQALAKIGKFFSIEEELKELIRALKALALKHLTHHKLDLCKIINADSCNALNFFLEGIYGICCSLCSFKLCKFFFEINSGEYNIALHNSVCCFLAENRAFIPSKIGTDTKLLSDFWSG